MLNRTIENHRQEIIADLICQESYSPAAKSINIVVHNQLDCVKKCVESIESSTEDYTIRIWNNDSDRETSDYLENLVAEHRIRLWRGTENIGVHQAE